MTGVMWCGQHINEMADTTLEEARVDAKALADLYMADPRAFESNMNAMIGWMHLNTEHERRHGIRERNERAIAEVLGATLA